jgi:predicted MFS family arabinose efflux permease
MSIPSSQVLPAPAPVTRLVWSNLATQFADQISLAAAPLVAVLFFGVGAGATGLLQMALTLPFLLLSLPAGILADRMSRRRLVVGAEAIRALSLLAITLLLTAELLTLPLLAVLGLLAGAGTVVYSVTAPAIVPSLVGREGLTAVNGRLELARSVALVAGPAVGGALVSWSGAEAAYTLAVVVSIFAVVLLIGLPDAAATAPARHMKQDVREVARFVLSHPLLRPIIWTTIFFNTAWFILQAVYVLYAVRVLGLSASAVGVTLGIFGAGMIVGGLLAPRIGRHLSFGAMLVIGPLSGLAGATTMVLTMFYPSPLLAGLSFFLFGAGPIFWNVTSTTLRQAVTPASMLGRASALVMMASFGARPIGAAIGALIGSVYGVEACLVVAAIGFLVQFGIIAISPVVKLHRLPEPAAA